MIEKASQNRPLAAISIIIACIAVIISIFAFSRAKRQTVASSAEAAAGILDKIKESGELHAGYGVYPPYSIEDPTTKEVSGYSIDIIESIVKELGIKVVWHRVNWDTMSADLKRGEYDVVADPIFQTISRAPEFAFSEPYAYFPDGIAVVRIGDNRFNSFESLDQKSISINVGMGQASESLLRAQFTKAEIIPVSVGTDDMKIFQDVLFGRTDAAIADLPNAKRIVDEHPDKLKMLFADNPSVYMPAGFALRPSDAAGAEFLSVCIRNLKSTGILKGIANKYNISLYEL